MLSIEEKLELVEKVPEHQEVHFDTQQVHDAAKDSLDFLAALALPLVFKYLFPRVFKSIWAWLLENVNKFRDFSQLAIGLPRGFGKTMLIKIFVLYCILFTKKQFILVICGTEGKAKNIVADIMGMLDERNIKKVFGDWRIGATIDRQDLKRFGFRGRTIILMAAGANSDIRGITLDNERPDVMIFDDIQTKEDAKSETISDALEDWLYSTAMKAKSPHGCLFVFIANMYPVKWSLLRRIKTNPTWDKFIAGGILADGTSLWEELQPIRQLLKEYERDVASGRPEVFYAEVLNDETATTNFLLDLTKVPLVPYHKEDIHLGSFIVIDPSNDKPNSDSVAVGYFQMHMNAEYIPVPCMREVTSARRSPLDTIEEALRMAFKWNCPFIVAESNAYQYSLLFWFNYICEQRGIAGIQIADIYSGQLKKSTRILNAFKELVAGELFVDPECQPLVWQEAREYKPLQQKNVDNILDLLTYATKTYVQYKDFIESTLIIANQEFATIKLRSAKEIAGF
jgi:hypothetical protein